MSNRPLLIRPIGLIGPISLIRPHRFPLFLKVSDGVVEQGHLAVAQVEGAAQGGFVHRGAGHGGQSRCGAEQGDVLRDDARVGGAHEARTVGRRVAQLLEVRHDDERHGRRGGEVLPGRHERAHVVRADTLEAVRRRVVEVSPLGRGHVDVHLLAVLHYLCLSIAVDKFSPFSNS